MNGKTRPADMLQNYEMVHIPMQNRGEPQAAQMFNLQPERPTRETKLGCSVHYSSERRAFKRDGMLPTQRVEIAVSSMIRGYHRQASKPAFARGRLANFG